MVEFPEKIWAIEKGYPSHYRVSCSVLEHEPDEATEYVRADLYAALEEKLAEARKAPCPKKSGAMMRRTTIVMSSIKTVLLNTEEK